MNNDVTQTEKCIDSLIGQPDDPALPEIESLTYPMRSGGRAAIARFKNGAELQYLDREKGIRQQTIFPDGRDCESFVINTDDSPSKRLLDTVIEYQTIDVETLRRRWSGMWPVLEVNDADV